EAASKIRARSASSFLPAPLAGVAEWSFAVLSVPPRRAGNSRAAEIRPQRGSTHGITLAESCCLSAKNRKEVKRGERKRCRRIGALGFGGVCFFPEAGDEDLEILVGGKTRSCDQGPTRRQATATRQAPRQRMN